MIHQFMYARKREGYRQLNDWGNTDFSKDDIAGMESLKKYALASGMDSTNLPECIYFYNIDCSVGRVGVVGKTSYVRAGSSKESGDRETSIIHKYIFSDQDYNVLLNKPKLIFDIKSFCETVENASAYDTEKLELERICAPSGGVGPGEMLEIIKAFGLSEDDFVYFLYALMDASYKLGKRVYLLLPSNDRHGSDLALKFCEGVFTRLPRFIVKNCGFITYTDTFHNTTTNNIPGAISLIFVANCESSALKLSNVSGENYVFDMRHLFTPKFKLDPFTREMLEDMKKTILYASGTNNYNAFYKAFNEKISHDCTPTPEIIGAAYQFYYIYNALRNKGACIGSPSQVANILTAFLQNTDVITEEIDNDVIDYTNRLLAAKNGEILLDYIAGIYDTYEPIKSILVEKVCEQCKEVAGLSKSKEDLLNILERASSKSEELLHRVYDRMYGDPRYYDQASLLVAINLENWLKSDKSPNESRIKNIFESISELYKQYPGLVLHQSYVGYIFAVFKQIIYRNNPVNYDDVLFLYGITKGFTGTCKDCGIYFTMVRDLVSDVIDEMNINNLGDDEMDKLRKWKNTILKEFRSLMSQTLARKLELYEVRDYKAILEQNKIGKTVEFLSNKTNEEIANIFPCILNEAMSCISSEYKYIDDIDKYYYDRYNLILFLAVKDSNNIDKLCVRILKYQGIFAMKRLYDNIMTSTKVGNGIDIEYVKSCMRLAFLNEFGTRYFDRHHNEEIEKFVRQTLGQFYMLDDDNISSTEKKSGKNPFRKK